MTREVRIWDLLRVGVALPARKVIRQPADATVHS